MTAMVAPAGGGSSKGARLSIGALSKATGIPVETLRTWETRYGFPVPERKPSGHRVYPLSSVPRLRRIAQALSQGHRAGEVLTASETDLNELLSAVSRDSTGASAVASAGGADIPELMSLVEAFDADRLTLLLLTEWARLGPLEFLEMRVAPLVREVGEAWESGRFDVYHEHFLSERVGDLLRSLRLPFEERAKGPLVILATLPKERHGLGLQMAALTVAAAGCRVLNLGTETPLPEMASLCRDLRARALAISVSEATRGTGTSSGIRRLRGLLPKRVWLLVGGEGAPRTLPKGTERMKDLRNLDAWAQSAVGSSAGPR
jgi:methanogenic corrinoid protein MtbC1